MLLPEAFYEATLLQEVVRQPCMRHGTDRACRQLRYPTLPDGAAPVSVAQAGYFDQDGRPIALHILDDVDTIEVRH